MKKIHSIVFVVVYFSVTLIGRIYLEAYYGVGAGSSLLIGIVFLSPVYLMWKKNILTFQSRKLDEGELG
ncbi:MAG: hypothetical protein LAT68_05550 [Cyclobacteriaceae bacterium]|nr:hypothetical protein [Cyclobacteriaceae bacterium]MCH8515776.1 hypothetical protein [Cyclobacteriaceae bacterium]